MSVSEALVWVQCGHAVAGDARIHTLNLSANNIGDRGAAALAEMLKVSRTHASHTPINQILGLRVLKDAQK